MAKYHSSQLRQQLRSGRTLFASDYQRPEVTRRELMAVHAFAREGRTEEYFDLLKKRRKRQGKSSLHWFILGIIWLFSVLGHNI